MIANKIPNKKIFVIAEVSANHGQSFNRAVAMIRKAKECGADAVKFQCYTPDTITINVDNSYFRVKHAKWGGQTLYQLYEKAYTPWGWFKKLKKVADDLGLIFFATAFDETAVDFLEDLKVPFHKIASFELVDLPLIRYASRTGKPIILSTGMASLSEVREAVDVAKKSGAKDVSLLKCVSSYPASPENMNLNTIPDMRTRFDCRVGLSDHTLGTCVAIAAVSVGATIIEKHFILSRRIKTPDSFFSIEPDELKELVKNIRIAEKALGEIHYGSTSQEKKTVVFRRSLFVVKDVKKGDIFDRSNVKSVRPGHGLSPKMIDYVLGKSAKKDIRKGTPLARSLMANKRGC